MGRSETLLNFPSGLSTWIANSALHNLKELVFFFFQSPSSRMLCSACDSEHSEAYEIILRERSRPQSYLGEQK